MVSEATARQCEAPTTVKAFLYEQRRANVVAIFGDDADQALIDYFAGEAPPIPLSPALLSKEATTQARWESVTGEDIQSLYNQGKTSQEIGKLYGVSKAKVIQAASAQGIDRSSQLRRTP
ncbi:hypothetical protein [Desulfosporosinus sp. BG]|uniref:hypothetical protein n=1 Tax=Desulfosporosinus sp. BG TaxID=1633135 RepID=UPI00083A1E12|nr:hypothetical protein [Desulfosporosinus sp. BG]ODA41247.1 hypothetical protein DSBG_2018 [Desulfosporosinus sp. BG]